MSSPTPAVVASRGWFPSAPPASSRPATRAISMTAVPRSSRQPASTGAPSGPVTTVVRSGPPSTSSRPSPPSAMGISTQSAPAAVAARPMAAATSRAVPVPRNLSGAATTFIEATSFRSESPYAINRSTGVSRPGWPGRIQGRPRCRRCRSGPVCRQGPRGRPPGTARGCSGPHRSVPGLPERRWRSPSCSRSR